MTLIITLQEKERACLAGEMLMTEESGAVYRDHYPKILIWFHGNVAVVTGYAGSVGQRHGDELMYADQWLARRICELSTTFSAAAVLRKLHGEAGPRRLQLTSIGCRPTRDERSFSMFTSGWTPTDRSFGTQKRYDQTLSAIGNPGDTDGEIAALWDVARSDPPASLIGAIRWRAAQTAGVGETVIAAQIVPRLISLRLFPAVGWTGLTGTHGPIRGVTTVLPIIVADGRVVSDAWTATRGTFSWQVGSWEVVVTDDGPTSATSFAGGEFNRRRPPLPLG